MTKSKTLSGKSISGIRTLSSMYDNGHIIELIGKGKGKVYRMSITEFNKVTKTLKFKTEKKTKYTWLEIVE